MISNIFFLGIVYTLLAGYLIRLDERFIIPVLIVAFIYAVYKAILEINNGSPDSGDF